LRHLPFFARLLQAPRRRRFGFFEIGFFSHGGDYCRHRQKTTVGKGGV
jgi:hypothetical protein